MTSEVTVPEAAIEAAAIALWNREGGGPDPVPDYIRHDAYATLAAALPHLSIPSASAPIQGDAAGAAAPARAELVRQALIKAKLTSHDDAFVQASTREIVNAIAALPALTAADARVVELELLRTALKRRSGSGMRRLAEMAEPGAIGAFAARDAAVARAEAAEAELARLQSVQPTGHRPESEEVVAVKPLEWRLRALHPHADRK